MLELFPSDDVVSANVDVDDDDVVLDWLELFPSDDVDFELDDRLDPVELILLDDRVDKLDTLDIELDSDDDFEELLE